MRRSFFLLDLACKGESYKNLPPSFIIFICMNDPFDEGLPVYTLDVNCLERPSAHVGHGFLWKALSAPAWDKLPEGRLRNLLHYVWTGDPGDDSFIGRLADAVEKANENEEWLMEKMALLTFEEDLEIQKQIAMEESRKLGQEIGLAQGLEEGREIGLAEGREQGRAEGREQGRAEGREQGRAEGAHEVSALMALLLDSGRLDDARRAAEDEAYRSELMNDLGAFLGR